VNQILPTVGGEYNLHEHSGNLNPQIILYKCRYSRIRYTQFSNVVKGVFEIFRFPFSTPLTFSALVVRNPMW